ncbi:MAG: tetratricopeptide repeat protein [Oligoflexia bacterium]|nr:tetratricopeptide repeat protein [Oligoflexia bacterium]
MRKLPKQTFFVFALLAVGSPAVVYAYSSQEFAKVFSPQDARIDQYRDAEIKQLQLVLSRAAPREQKPDLMLRLAELYTEKYRLFFFKENEIWSKKMDGYLQLPLNKQKYTKKPVLDSSVSKTWLKKAVDVLGKIPQQKGKYERIDEVYYYLAFNQWELGNKNEAVKNFQNLVKEKPNSKFASEAYRYMGDYTFSKRDFRLSKSYYERALSRGETPARPRILYGLAWSKFKLREYKGAVSSMQEAIETGKDNAEAARAGLALQRDAGESLAMFYTEGGNSKQAGEFFVGLFGEEEGVLHLRKLAENYQKQGRYSDALSINKQLLDMGGEAAKQGQEQRFEIMVNSLNVATTKGDRTRQAALLRSMTAEFVTNAESPDAEKVEILKTQVRKAATLAHKEGNQSKNPKAAFQRAEQLYSLYLSAFAAKIDAEDSAEIRYYLADVYSQLGQHKQAAAIHKEIMELSKSEKSYAKYGKDSAAAMVYSIDSYFNQKGKNKKLSQEDGDQVIAAIDTYVSQYPDDKNAPQYEARAAGILVTSGRDAEAKPRLHKIIEKYPRTTQAWDAASTLLKEAEEKKNYAEAESLASNFLQNKPLLSRDKNGEFKKKLESIVSRAQFQKVKGVEQNQDFASAASAYEKLAKDSRDAEVREKALNNAAVSYEKAGDRENELRVYFQMLASKPGNKSIEKNIIGYGNELFLSGKYAQAAGVYEQFYNNYQKNLKKLSKSSQEEALEAIRSAALLRTAIKDSEEAANDYKLIVDAANQGIVAALSIAGEFLFDTAKKLQEDNPTEAIKAYQKYIAVFPKGDHTVGATMESAALYLTLKEEEKAQSYYRTAISKVKAQGKQASAEELGYGARARLELLRPLEEAFENSPLRLPEKRLKDDINAKLAALERLNKGYIEVMDFGDGTWGVEAFKRMALAYKTFAQSLESAPIPSDFSPEDKAKFKAQLVNVAKPVYVKVSETLETALQKGEQLQVVGSVMANTYLLYTLESAKPDRLPLVQSLDWKNPTDWIAGAIPRSQDELDSKRNALRANQTDLNAWLSIGNWHLARGEAELAEIFYLYAIQKNKKFAPAINNLAYLKGRSGDIVSAYAGFKSALAVDEFFLPSKKNSARIQMASGLWRHANLAYRQLEVRAPNDQEIKRGLSLSNLAMGRVSQVNAGIIDDIPGDDGKFAKATLALAKGDKSAAKSQLDSISSNPYAKIVLDHWAGKGEK